MWLVFPNGLWVLSERRSCQVHLDISHIDYKDSWPSWCCVHSLLMIKKLWYNKEFDWPLSLAPRKKTLNPWNLLSNRGIFVIHEPLGSHLIVYSDEVTPHGPLGSFRIEAGHVGKTSHRIRGLELWATFYELGHLPSGEGRGWRFTSNMWPIFNQSCLYNETPRKSLENKDQWSLLVGEGINVPGG